MTEIDCRICMNLVGQHLAGTDASSARCKIYGQDPAKATAACKRDEFKNYRPCAWTNGEFKPGMDVWCVERDADDDPVAVSGYVFLAKVQAAVIVSAYIDGESDLDGILIAHYEQTREESETGLCVFPACDCYPAKCLALEALAAESEA